VGKKREEMIDEAERVHRAGAVKWLLMSACQSQADGCRIRKRKRRFKIQIMGGKTGLGM